MPFKFEAELQDQNCKSLWTRSIYALSTVSDTIKITLRQASNNDTSNPTNGKKEQSQVLLTAVNFSRTSSLNCSFNVNFFQSFKIDGTLPDQAVSGDPNNARCFSLLVNSRTLNILFKDCGENSETFKLLLIHEGSPNPHDRIFSNRLFIEFRTKAGMTKRYTVNFRLGRESADLHIEQTHVEMLQQQYFKDKEAPDGEQKTNDEDEHSSRVHQIILESFILRNFISMFPVALEDFKIEIYPNVRKLLFHGFNRQDALSTRKKMSNLTTQPMSLSIQLNLSDLAFENILRTSSDPKRQKEKYQVSLRLRNLRTFIQLIGADFFMAEGNSVSTEVGGMGGHHSSIEEIGNNYCEIMMSKSGCPIVFERKYYADNADMNVPCCQVTLIAITDSEVDRIHIKGRELATSSNKSTSNESMKQQRNMMNYIESVHRISEPAVAPVVDQPLFVPMNAPTDNKERETENNHGESVDIDKGTEEEGSEDDTEEENLDNGNFESVFWENMKYHRTTMNEGNIPGEEEMEPSNGENDRSKKASKEKEDDDTNNDHIPETYLGPTQNVVKFKGLFDD